MKNQLVALVTGANQGIGLQIVKELAAKELTVLLGSRDLELGKKAAAAIGSNVVAVQLDVTDKSSIAAAAERVRIEFGQLDVLVQNAGVSTADGRHPGTPEEYIAANRPSVVNLDELRTVWETNVFGVLAVYQAMLPILRDTPNARIVHMSSGAGSLMLASDTNSPIRHAYEATYAASKTALNGLTLAMAIELESEGIKVNAVTPGPTRTRMNPVGTDTVEDGAAEAVRIAMLSSDGPTGTFTHATFGTIPW